jgi:hypothetical protein
MDYVRQFSQELVQDELQSTENFNQCVQKGIFRESTYHELHNWEYQLLGSNATPRPTSLYTPRTVSTEGSSETNSGSQSGSGNGGTDGSNGGGTDGSSGGGTDGTNGGGTDGTNGGGTPPGAPTDLCGTPDDGQVSLSWIAPSDTGSAAIDYYEYQYRENNAGTWGDWGDYWTSTDSAGTNITDTSVDVTGLTNGTEYEFQVRAVSSAGEGSESTSVTATLQRTMITIRAPGPPTNLTMSSEDDEQVTLSWYPSSDWGTPHFTHYQYRYATVSDPMESDFNAWARTGDTDNTDTTFTVEGLTNGVDYYFQVRAANDVVQGAASNTARAIPATVPGAPTGLRVTGRNQNVRLSWTAPSDDGGAEINDYEYRYVISSSSFGDTWSQIDDTNTDKTIAGLTNGTRYYFQVRAVNRIGPGEESGVVPGTPATAPLEPQNVTLTAGDGEVTLTWQPPTDTGGAPITGYAIRYREGSSGNWSYWPSVSGSDLSAIVTGLTNGTEYEFGMASRNSVGIGRWSNRFGYSSYSATPRDP